MSSVIYALTKNGAILANAIGKEIDADVYVNYIEAIPLKELSVKTQAIKGTFKALVKATFNQYETCIFIMATGIVVRLIAPLVHSKTCDPAVIVIDEKGEFVISLLSGHIGGANEKSIALAKITGGIPIITTATDVNKTLAFDIVAKHNNLIIKNIHDLKHISSGMIHTDEIALYSDAKLRGDLPQNVIRVHAIDALDKYSKGILISFQEWVKNRADGIYLHLIPKCLVLGIGCKRNTSLLQLDHAIKTFLMSNAIEFDAIAHLSTVDVKSDEEALLEYSKRNNLKLDIISRERIRLVESQFKGSDFVKKTIGVSAVSEPCAFLSSKRGRCILPKTAFNGITLALYEMEREYYL